VLTEVVGTTFRLKSEAARHSLTSNTTTNRPSYEPSSPAGEVFNEHFKEMLFKTIKKEKKLKTTGLGMSLVSQIS
jgi:hypothetical protein